jgi:hypothetical protein
MTGLHDLFSVPRVGLNPDSGDDHPRNSMTCLVVWRCRLHCELRAMMNSAGFRENPAVLRVRSKCQPQNIAAPRYFVELAKFLAQKNYGITYGEN